MISTIGTDPISGVSRYTFGVPELIGGVKPILVMVGLFAMSELLIQTGTRGVLATAEAVRVVLPKPAMMRRLIKPQGIGCAVGTFEG